MILELIIRKGDRPGRIYRLEPGDVRTVGRSSDCDLVLADAEVSRHHCQLAHTGDGLRVVDLDSANGTRVDGVAVEETVLRPGHRLALGPVVLECRAPNTGPAYPPEGMKLTYSESGGRTVVRKVVETPDPETGSRDTPAADEELRRAHRSLGTAHQLSRQLARARTPTAIHQAVLESVLQSLQADRVALLLRGDGGDVNLVAARARDPREKPGDITISRTVVRDVLDAGLSILSQDAGADERFREGHSIIRQRIRSVLCVPLANDERILGVLYADSRSLTGAFDESDLELLALIGNQAGIAIDRAQLMAEMEDFFFDTVRAIVATIDAKDGYTHRHSERVAALAVRIAREVGIDDEEQLETIQLAGLLHDLGKIGVPEAILNKEGGLSPEEFAEMKKHPVHGANILRHIRNPKIEAVLPGVRHHHERWDGSGYPDGLVELEIPFLGRLLAVADVLDALSSDRSYRAAFSLDGAVETIVADAGRHFDPEFAQIVADLHDRGELALVRQVPEMDPQLHPAPTPWPPPPVRQGYPTTPHSLSR